MDLLVKGKADLLVLVLGRAGPSFMNSVTGSGFVAKCSNILADLSFMNSITGSSFVARCSNILQDIQYLILIQFLM